MRSSSSQQPRFRLDHGNRATFRSLTTLADHRHDARAWVRNLLGVTDGHDQADTVEPEPGTPVPVAWELVKPTDPDLSPLRHRLLRALSQRMQWRHAINAARDRAAQYDTDLSATAIQGGT